MTTNLPSPTTRSPWRLLAVVLVALAGVAGLGAAQAPSVAQAGAVTVSCGQTLVEDAKLANDLTDCPGDGLTAGAAGITVDLNGHTIDGSGVGIGIFSGSFANVTIQGGSVTEFGTGIRIGLAAQGNSIRSVRVSKSTARGIDAEGPQALVTASVAFDNDEAGIGIFGAGSSVTNSTANGNETLGIRVAGAGPTRVSGNTVLSNGTGGVDAVGGAPTQLTNNVANGNGAAGNGAAGLSVHATVVEATLTKNTASFNTGLGIRAGSGGVTDGGGNKAGGNEDLRQCQNVVCAAP